MDSVAKELGLSWATKKCILAYFGLVGLNRSSSKIFTEN